MKVLIFWIFLTVGSAFSQMDMSTPGGLSVIATFISDPVGAEIYVSNTFIGRTPTSVRINANTTTLYRALIQNSEYLPYEGSFTFSKDDTISIYVPRANLANTPVQPLSSQATPTLSPTINTQVTPSKDFIEITFTSDPIGAYLSIDFIERGRTPITLSLERGKAFYYTVNPQESFVNFTYYQSYSNVFTPLNNDAISVWLDRFPIIAPENQLSNSSSNSTSQSGSDTRVIRSCCKYCSKGKPCGDTCISRNKTCHVGPGCAC